MAPFSFSRNERIRKHSDFLKIYQNGRRKETPHFKIALWPNNLQWRRLGITVSKKTGNAVKRNYIKRRLREYFRLHKAQLPEATDIILTAKPGAARLTYSTICGELNKQLIPDTVSRDAT